MFSSLQIIFSKPLLELSLQSSIGSHIFTSFLFSFLVKYSNENKIDLLDFTKIQCDNGSKFCYSISTKNKKIYYDRGHLTLDGIDFFSLKLSKKFNY